MKPKPKSFSHQIHYEYCSDCKKLKEVRKMANITAEPGGKAYFICTQCYFKKGKML